MSCGDYPVGILGGKIQQNGGGAVGGAVIDQDHFKELWELENSAYDLPKGLFLIVNWHHYGKTFLLH
jgi:hypothetical protein